MSNHAGHDNLRNEIILAVSQSGWARCWPQEVGLYREYKNPERVVRVGVNGASDILGITIGGFFLAIEVKTGGGTLRDSQKNFKALMQKMGGLFIEGRSVPQVLAELKQFLCNKFLIT